MHESPRKQLRLIILAGLAIGLAVIFLILNPLSGSNRPATSNKSTPQQNQENPEPLPEPEPYTFPSGQEKLLPDHRLVALYGTPDTPVLGSLGEQSVDKALTRIKDLAQKYQKYSKEPIYPAFEIITTVASAGPTNNKDYSNELAIEKIKPWVEAAKQNDVYVLLDLQPGLADFLTQAKMYESLLKEPHVGLALDPEWRLKPGQRHMKQIGSVSANEVNKTADWLADLTKANNLPQKLFMVHQFKLSMITDRNSLSTARPELAWLIQMDGLGTQSVKQDTWRTIRRDASKGIYFGWKNFIDEDKPMLSPKQTMQVEPKPYYVSYQ